MLTESIVFAIVLGFLMGGKLNPLLETQFKKVRFLIIGAMFQAVAYGLVKLNIHLGENWVIPVIHSISYGFLLAFTSFNRSYSGMRLISLGIVLNALVISLNGGLMPVDPAFIPEASRQLLKAGTGTHGILTEGTRLKFLADIFYVDILVLGKQLFSLGDLFIDLGIVLFAVKQMRS